MHFATAIAPTGLSRLMTTHALAPRLAQAKSGAGLVC